MEVSSRIHEPPDRLGGLPDLGVGFGASSCGGIDDTMTEMVFEQFHSYCMQRFFIADIWVRMSMQHLSSSTIRCSPRD